MDGTGVPTPVGPHTGRNPTDRSKLGNKRRIARDGQGMPVTSCVIGADRHVSVVFEELLDTLPALGGRRDRHAAGPGNRLRTRAAAVRDAVLTSNAGHQGSRAQGGGERNDRLERHR